MHSTTFFLLLFITSSSVIALEYNLGVFLPFEEDSEGSAQSQVKQFKSAVNYSVDLVNNLGIIESNNKLVVKIEYTTDTPTFPLENAARALNLIQQDIVAVLDCSRRTLPRYFIANESIPHASVTGTADLTEINRDFLSSEWRVIYRSGIWARCVLDFLKSKGWKKFTLFVNADGTSQNNSFLVERVKNNLRTLAPQYDTELVQTLSFSGVTEIESLLKQLDSESNRIILILADAIRAHLFLNTAGAGDYNFEYIWIAPNLSSVTDKFIDEDISSTIQNIKGFFTLQAAKRAEKHQALVQGLQDYAPAVFLPGDPIDENIPYIVDIVNIYAHALNQMEKQNRTIAELYNVILESAYEGISGDIFFNRNFTPASPGHRQGNLEIMNFVTNGTSAGSFRLLTKWNPIQGFQDMNEPIYSDGTSITPSDILPKSFTMYIVLPSSIPGVYQWQVAANAAIKHVQEDDTLLKDYVWKVYYLDSEDSDAVAVNKSLTFIANRKPEIMITAGFKDVTKTLQYLLKGPQIPQLTFTAQGEDLSNKSLFPLLARTTPSDKHKAETILALMKFYGWTRFSLIHTKEDNTVDSFQSLRSAAEASGVNIVRLISIDGNDTFDIENGLKLIKGYGSTVIVCFAYPVYLQNIINKARELNMLGTGYAWITDQKVLLDEGNGLNVPDGLFTIAPYINRTSEKLDRMLNETKLSGVHLQNGTIDPSTILMYDTVYTAANVIQLYLNGSNRLGNGGKVMEYFKNVSFEGASGLISFDKNLDRATGLYSWYNFRQNHWDEFGVWDIESKSLISQNANEVIFLGGGSIVPFDIDASTLVVWNEGVGLGIGLMVALLLLITLGVMLITLKYRNNVLVRASSPFFLLINLLGTFIALGSVITSIGPISVNKCMIKYWFLYVGFPVAYGSLVIKNWRVYRLWTSQAMKVIKISNQRLSLYNACLTLPFVIVLILMSVIDPPKPAVFEGGLVRCTSDTDAYKIILLAMMFAVLVFGAVISFLTRSIPNLYNECKHIALATYNLAFFLIVALIVSEFVNTPVAVFLMYSLGLTLGFFGMSIILFSPKFWIIFFDPEKLRELSSGRSGTKRTTSTLVDTRDDGSLRVVDTSKADSIAVN